MIEFAIVVPLLLLLVFAIIDFGRFFTEYGQLVSAARDGARVAAVRPAATLAEQETLSALVQSVVLDRANSGSLTAAMITLHIEERLGVRFMQVRVAGVPFTSSVPLVLALPLTYPVIVSGFRHELE
jgi:Flp pilus assembly protein TadG